MALMDGVLVFSDAQTFTSVATHESTNVLNLGAANLQLGAGTPVYLNIRVNTAVTSAGAPTIQFQLKHHTAAAVAASGTVIIETPTFLKAALTAGTWVLRVAIPYEIMQQYVAVAYVVATAALTAGSFDAWLDLGPQSNVSGLAV